MHFFNQNIRFQVEFSFSGALRFVGSVFAIRISITDPFPRDTDTGVIALEVLNLARNGSAVGFVRIVTAVIGTVANPSQRDARKTISAPELAVSAFLIGWAIAFVRAIGAVTRSVTLPPLRQASVLVFTAEFFLAASTAGELVVPLAAILSSVAHPTFGNTRIVAAATVFVRQTFTFGSC